MQLSATIDGQSLCEGRAIPRSTRRYSTALATLSCRAYAPQKYQFTHISGRFIMYRVSLGTAACAAAALFTAAGAQSTFAASYRKDYFMTDYLEFGVPDPVDGGRIHIVGTAHATGAIGSVVLNGTALNMSTGLNPDSWAADWVRVEPINGLTAGQPFWISLHTRVKSWDAARASGDMARILVMSADGSTALVNGSFPVQVPTARVTWVTTYANRSVLHVFLHNDGQQGVTATRVRVNGADVLPSIPSLSLSVPPAQTVLWALSTAVVGGPQAVAPGAVWTVEVWWNGSETAASGSTADTAAGGLLFRELFPIEAWEKGGDCTFPTVNDTSYDIQRSLGIDTFFLDYTLDSSCHSNLTAPDIINKLAPQYGFYGFPTAEPGQTPYGSITDDSHLAGWFLADEDDTVVDDKARTLLANTVKARAAWPGQPTYAGGASQKYTGAYSGITDIKGMDAYIGACAPHYALLAMPARGSYDYLANTRVNHAPGPTWLYTQGFEDGWDGKGAGGKPGTDRQANSPEIAIQVASITAAGGKGAMVFQTQNKYSEGESAPAFATLGTLLREMGAMRELYRAGDATGMAVPVAQGKLVNGSVIVEEILHPRAVVLLLINTAAVNDTYNDICCALSLPCHFTFVPSPLDYVAFNVPAGFSVVDTFEVWNATVLSNTFTVSPSSSLPGYGMSIPSLSLGTEGPGHAGASGQDNSIVRTLVLATDTQLRGEIAQALSESQSRV